MSKTRLIGFLCGILGMMQMVSAQVFPDDNGDGFPFSALSTDSIKAFIEQNYFNRGQETVYALRELYARAKATRDFDLQVRCIYWDALTEYSQNNRRGNLSSELDSLIRLPEIRKNRYHYLMLNYAKALSELSHGNFAVAFRYALEAHQLALECGDRKLTVETATTLGNIGPYIQDYGQSRYFYQMALENADKNTLKYYRIQINYSRLLFLERKYDSAIAYLSRVIPDIRQAGDEGLLSVCYLNMGSYYSAIEKRDSAYLYYKEGLKLIGSNGNRNLRTLLYENIGNYFRDKGNYKQALFHYGEARKIALTDSNYSSYASLAYELSILYARREMLDSSYYYLMEYNQLIYKIQQPVTMESQKNYVNMVMELADNRMQLSEKTVELKNKQFVILLITAFGIIATVILLWLVAMERRRRSRQMLLLKEIENQELTEQLDHEKEIQRLNAEKNEQKIRELTSYSLLLSNKNNVLRSIQEMVLKAKEEKDEGGFDKIKRLIDMNLNMDGDYWEQFVGHFVQVEPHFFENLKQYCLHLTQNEIKLCAYIKIGLTSKQIAQLLNLSQESVNKNRYRLRKKLKLEKDMDLDSFIARF